MINSIFSGGQALRIHVADRDHLGVGMPEDLDKVPTHPVTATSHQPDGDPFARSGKPRNPQGGTGNQRRQGKGGGKPQELTSVKMKIFHDEFLPSQRMSNFIAARLTPSAPRETKADPAGK
ncbi:MAG: hypothetical protein Kow0040_22670 [Thermogutta sp.]